MPIVPLPFEFTSMLYHFLTQSKYVHHLFVSKWLMFKDRWLLVWFALYAALLFGGIGSSPIYILDEARNAGCALEMLDRNDWVVPTFNGSLRTEKPSLHYYFMMAGYTLFGNTSFGGRFFSALCGLLTLLLTCAFAWKYHGPAVTRLSAMLHCASLHLVLQFQLATPDPYLIFFNALSIIMLFESLRDGRMLSTVIAYLAMGCSVWAKGPVGIVMPAGAMLLYCLFSRQLSWNFIKKLRLPLGALLVLVVAGPWQVLVWQATDGAWAEGFYLTHNVHRYTETMEGHGGIFLLMPLLLLLAFLPFVGLVPGAWLRWWKSRLQDPALFLSGSAAACIVLFFSFSSTKLPSYISPALPFAALVLAVELDRRVRMAQPLRWPWIVPVALGLALAVGAYLGLSTERSVAHMAWWSLVFVPLVAGGILAFLYGKNTRVHIAILAAGVGGALSSAGVSWMAFPAVYRENPVSRSLHILEGQPVVTYQRFNPAYVYHKGPLQGYQNAEAVLQKVEEQPNTLVLTQGRHLPELDMGMWEVLFSEKDLFELQHSVILRKRDH